MNRALFQPGAEFAAAVAAAFVAQSQAIADAASVDDLLDRLSDCGILLRLTDSIRPTMFRCATVSLPELKQSRRIGDIVRLGRVRRIEDSAIMLDAGTVPTSHGTLHIDCSADGLERRPARSVFDGPRITLQSVRTCQQVFSAAFIAHVEAAYSDDAVKNELCVPVPHPDTDLDWLSATLANTRNQLRWVEDAGLGGWLQQARLDWFGRLGPSLPSDPDTRTRTLQQRGSELQAMCSKLEKLLVHPRSGG